MSQPSRLAPNAAMDATVGQLIAEGLATSATVLVSNLLRTAAKCATAASGRFTDSFMVPHGCWTIRSCN